MISGAASPGSRTARRSPMTAGVATVTPERDACRYCHLHMLCRIDELGGVAEEALGNGVRITSECDAVTGLLGETAILCDVDYQARTLGGTEMEGIRAGKAVFNLPENSRVLPASPVPAVIRKLAAAVAELLARRYAWDAEHKAKALARFLELTGPRYRKS